MAYDEYLQERIDRILSEKNILHEARKMMGGLCYMVDEKMCFGIVKGDFMARVGTEQYSILMEREEARPMDFTKRPMNGYLFVAPEGVDREDDLEFWIQRCLDFNPEAKASKKRKKSSEGS
ncbi:TfoX/Sxy family protein [Crocinitomicaceae bacterium]|nr:TfoX/Sxy family protein [Crocinitomicaceae bacterium]MDC0257883.1 TfoX/Sxy family protein [Crocinitomicaceae bacterium]